MARAAIYARYSSDNQRDASIEDQVRLCRKRLEREGWQLAEIYADHGISGSTALLRPGYQKLLEDARTQQFGIVVAEGLDRLSRDQEDVAALYKHLSFAGVKVVTLAEGDVNELHVGLKGTMNALYLKDLAQKTHRGLEGRVRKGRSGGGRCYGYDVIPGPEGDRGARTVNAAEAAVVERVYLAFASGKSPRAIAHELNGEGVPGPRGRNWSDTTIRGHHERRTGLLHNELYIGRLVWNRLRYLKDPRTGKRISRLNPEEEWIIKEVPELRILEQDLWDRAQARLRQLRAAPAVTKARQTRFWERRRPKHLLTGLAVCGMCGTTLSSVGRDYLACRAAKHYGTCSNRRGIRRQILEDVILSALQEQLMEPDLVRVFVAAYHEEVNRLSREREADTVSVRTELTRIETRIGGLIDAVADGLKHPGLQTKLDDLEARRSYLQKNLETAPQPRPRLHPNLAELYKRKVEELRAALEDPAIRDEALDILRGLVDRVAVSPVEGGFEIELVGDIAKMIEAPKEGASEPFENESSVKVVAGAGFEPATFRL